MCTCILVEEHKDQTVNPSLEQKQRSLVIELRKNVWNLNKTRPEVAIVIGEGSNRIKEGFSAFTMQDPKWQTIISEEFIVQKHALVILWIPIFS